MNISEATEASPILVIGMRAYIWVDVFGVWQDGIWDGDAWRVADGDTVDNQHVSKWVIQ